VLNELRENQGTITRTEEAMTPIEESRSRTIQLQHSSSSLNRKRPASPVSLADVNPRSRYGSLKKRVTHSDVYGGNDEYPQTPTIQSDQQGASSPRGSSPTFSLEERAVPSYASPHTLGHIDDEPMDDTFPAIDATNEDGMLSPDHAMSLPSPTLSPITGAANHPHEYFGSPTHALIHRSPTPLEDDDPYTVQGMLNTYSGYPAIMQIPAMCETFDVLPPNIQTYVLWQLLRRCQIPTLQFAAKVIEPTLKRDFLADLPLELSLNILKYFDSKSLCRAGAVSRTWLKIVDADDYIWKHRFEQDGFKLEEADTERVLEEEEEILPSRRSSRTSVSSATGRRRGSFQSTRRSVRLNSIRPIKRNSLKSPKTSPSKLTLNIPKPPSYKELYRHHFIVRSNWMNSNVRPRHISFQGHGRNVVTCLQFDSDRVISGSDDSTINIYETRTGRLAHTLHGHDGGVWALQYLDNILVSGSTDRTVRVWDIERAECTQIFYGHTSTVRCLQIIMPRLQSDGEYFPEEPIIVTGSRDSTLRVWSLPKKGSAKYLPTPPEAANEETNATPADATTSPGTTAAPATISSNPYFLRKLTGHSQSVRALSGAGNTLVSGSYDHTVRVWKISTGECRWRLQGHTAKVYSVVYDVEKDRCFSGSMDHCVKVWDLTRGVNLFTLEGISFSTLVNVGHTSLVGLLDLSHDYLVSAAADSTLRIWNPDTGKCQHVLSAHTGAITCFQHNENMVLSGSDGTLKMWDVRTGEFVRDVLHGLSGVWQIKFDERRCVAAVQRNGVTWIDVLTFGEEDGRMVRAGGGRVIIPENLNP
jgi:F-box and WD-40 domain protein CDC4